MDNAMDIQFERYHLQCDLLSPLQGFETVSVPTEVRIDPLTKRRCRIITWGLPDTGRIDLSRMVEESRGCIFCPENVHLKTPKFLKEIAPEGRLSRGEAVGFPNLFPAGSYGSVIVLCSAHFRPLNELTPSLYEDGLSLAVEIIRRTVAYDPNGRFWQVSQNFLHPAGSSILHPHLQVIGDPIPTNEMEWLREAGASYYERNRSIYWQDLVRKEEELGERYIAKTGNVHWFVSFAPIGFNEVCAVVEGHSSLLTLTPADLSLLARGIVSTLRYYHDKNLNSFNLTFYSISGEETHWLLLRIISRTPLQPYYLNDWTSFEALHSELTLNIYPEGLCREIRPYFS
ncbi:MAG: hypothetical protein N3G78_02445 [Desulfobacterota bacterium]|nr:hypothetical protein [Thermodesulfobacteriota bacterium]